MRAVLYTLYYIILFLTLVLSLVGTGNILHSASGCDCFLLVFSFLFFLSCWFCCGLVWITKYVYSISSVIKWRQVESSRLDTQVGSVGTVLTTRQVLTVLGRQPTRVPWIHIVERGMDPWSPLVWLSDPQIRKYMEYIYRSINLTCTRDSGAQRAQCWFCKHDDPAPAVPFSLQSSLLAFFCPHQHEQYSSDPSVCPFKRTVRHRY